MVPRPLLLTGTDRLLAEMMAQILDDASHEIQTLHACSLVCIAWRSYLLHSPYEEILLCSARQLHMLACAARIYPTVRDRLAPVHSIILEKHGQHGPSFAHVFPLMLSPYLHQVKRLSFGNCTLQPLHKTFFSMLRQLKHVKHLRLSTSSRNTADLLRIVYAFPQLEELYIEGVITYPEKPLHPTPPHLRSQPCMPKLTIVRIDDNLPQFFCDLVAWLSSSGVCSTIRTLHISTTTSRDWEAEPTNALLAHTASTLEHLRMFIGVRELEVHWGFPQFLHLRVLDITFFYQRDPMSTEEIQQRLHNIFASLTSPVLERVRLQFSSFLSSPLYTRDTDSRDATTLADPAQYADFHTVLARPIFSSLHRVTVELYDDRRQQKMMSAKDMPHKRLGFLRALLAPWYVRGIVSLACVLRSSPQSFDAVVDGGKGLRWLELLNWEDYLKNIPAALGLERHLDGTFTTAAREYGRNLRWAHQSRY